jgi:hypothetical protein
MIQDQNYKSVQVFPIHADTYIGTATAVSTYGFKILHAEADATVTFTLEGGATKVISMLAGEDVGIADIVASVTSTATIRMS